MAYLYVRCLLADCMPREFIEKDRGASPVRVWEGELTVVAFRQRDGFLLDLFEPRDFFHCGTALAKNLPPAGLRGELVFLESFRSHPPRRLDQVRLAEPPLRVLSEDGLTFLCYTTQQGMRVACFRDPGGEELIVVERSWQDLPGARCEELAALGILAPGKVPAWSENSLLTAIFGVNYRRPHYDQKFRNAVSREYPKGEDGALTAVSYRDGNQQHTLVFAEAGTMVAARRTPRLPPANVVTGFDVLTRFFRSGNDLNTVTARLRGRGIEVRECDEAGLHFVVGVSGEGMVHADVFGPQGDGLLHRDRRVEEFDDAGWAALTEKGLVREEERRYRHRPRIYRSFPQPGPWPAPSLLSQLFSLPYRREYYIEKMGSEPAARHEGDIEVLVFSQGGQYPAFAFAENGNCAVFSRLPMLPPGEWTGYQVLAGAFGHDIGWRWETFRREFGNGRFIGEREECGFRYLCAVRDQAVIAVFAPDGRCLGQTTRPLESWDRETREALKGRGMLP